MKARVTWRNDLSAYFRTNYSVLEGNLLGLRLYNTVMDKFLFLLANSDLCCHIVNLFAGAIIAYADDLIVFSASVHVEFGEKYDIVFNCDKSLCGIVQKKI